MPISSVKRKDPTPEMLTKYEPFFAELQKDSTKTKGIDILHYQNPVTKQNDVTMIIFDLRIFQHEIEEMDRPTTAFQEIMEQQVRQAVNNDNPNLIVPLPGSE